ncbi:CAP domain-containing protein [Oribacterium sp. FC2011]|uniref:CAP domain-containing protein n=1 Tax=Oribacterium sp. FC2011 TaxID=1408311 RepID=UPI0004E18785|nr:CAP domain-containing protein [Oribacterium sp. FC2011]
MKNTKSIIARSFAAVLAASMSITSFAGTRLDGVWGEWKNNENGWWWENVDKSYPINQWVWLDGNGDNIAECYYFDENGYMAVNREIGGYLVNADGQWVDNNGTIQKTAVKGENSGNYENKKTDIEDDETFSDDNDSVEIVTKKTKTKKQKDAEAKKKKAESKKTTSTSKKNQNTDSDSDNTAPSEDFELDTDSIKELMRSYESTQIVPDTYDDHEKLQEMIDAVNIIRRENGLDEYEIDDDIMKACEIRAQELSVKFGHWRPDGTSAHTAIDEISGRYRPCCENIYTGKKSPVKIVNSWYSLEGHRNVLLSSTHNHIGVGHAKVDGKDYWVLLVTH